MVGLRGETVGAPKENERDSRALYDWVFFWMAGLVTFFVCTCNIGSSLFNNRQIVVATFLLAFSALLVTSMQNIVRPWFYLGLAFIGWLVFSNLAASMQGVVPASWGRVFDMAVQIAAFLVLVPAFRARPEAITWALGGLVLAFVVNSGWLVVTWNGLESPESYNWVWGLPNFVNIR